jgi:hypothetical protein
MTALYDAVYKRRNRYRPDEPLSLSANVTDPDDGRCYARGSCRCEQNGCQPTPGPGWYIHAGLYDKSQGRAHQGAKPREQWDYDPMIPRSRQAAEEPGRAFGADRIPAGEDQPPDRSGFRRTPKPAAPSTGRSARASGSARGRQQQAPAPAADESALAKFRQCEVTGQSGVLTRLIWPCLMASREPFREPTRADSSRFRRTTADVVA